MCIIHPHTAADRPTLPVAVYQYVILAHLFTRLAVGKSRLSHAHSIQNRNGPMIITCVPPERQKYQSHSSTFRANISLNPAYLRPLYFPLGHFTDSPPYLSICTGSILRTCQISVRFSLIDNHPIFNKMNNRLAITTEGQRFHAA